ncbi:MAG: hypothetical protein K1X53_01355 [Candidatus Sumerlaeaceae bacterium]|nr:hypothetical protein [Candidatus Sumerlaeaceae bacterium]
MESASIVAAEAAPDSPTSSLPRWLVAVLFLVVLGTAFSFAFTPLRTSQDEWWHLKTGKWILENGRLPKYDIFTYTGENIPWHNHEWLSEILFYKLFAWGEERVIGGVRALILFKSLIFAATIALTILLARLRSGAWVAALLVGLLATDISRRTIYPRPPILSYLLLAAFLILLYLWKMGRLRGRWLWVFVPATILWANLHGMVLLATVVCGGFAAGEFLENLRPWRQPENRSMRTLFSPAFLLLAGLTVAVLLCTMANPSGYEIFFLGGKFKDDPILKRVIAEMLPPPFLIGRAELPGGATTWYWNPLHTTFWVVAAGFVFLFAANRFRFPFGADYVLSAFFLYQAVMHVRLLPLFAVVCAGPLAWQAVEFARRFKPQAMRRLAVASTAATLILAATFVFAVGEPPPQTFFRRNMQLWRGEDRDPVSYPEPLMKFIIRTRFPDRMFSQINYCGYMMWWLSPEHHKLFTDNRFDIFGSQFQVPEATVVAGITKEESRFNEGWDEILDKNGVNFIVISRGAPLNDKLRQGSAWKLVYYYYAPGATEESGFNIWLRNDPRFADVARRALDNFRAESPGQPLPEEFDRMVQENKRSRPLQTSR